MIHGGYPGAASWENGPSRLGKRGDRIMRIILKGVEEIKKESIDQVPAMEVRLGRVRVVSTTAITAFMLYQC